VKALLYFALGGCVAFLLMAHRHNDLGVAVLAVIVGVVAFIRLAWMED
jgi:hypothetical protein